MNSDTLFDVVARLVDGLYVSWPSPETYSQNRAEPRVSVNIVTGVLQLTNAPVVILVFFSLGGFAHG